MHPSVFFSSTVYDGLNHKLLAMINDVSGVEGRRTGVSCRVDPAEKSGWQTPIQLHISTATTPSEVNGWKQSTPGRLLDASILLQATP